jgi:hypothetical protein
MSGGPLVWVGLVLMVSVAMLFGLQYGLAYTDRSTVLTAVLLILFVSVAGNAYVSHNYKIESAEKMTATVISTEQGQSCVEGRCTYFIKVGYTYDYDGELYTSTGKKTFSNAYNAGKWQERNPAGKRISAFVVPDEPSVSFVEPKGFPETYWWKLCLFGLLLFLVGGWFLTLVEKRFTPHLKLYVDNYIESCY